MNSNKIRLAGKVAVALALTLVSAVGFAADKKAPGDMIAVVNGTIITQGELDRVLDYELRRAAQSGQQIPDAQMPKIENSILDSLIVSELLFQESKKQGIQVKPETVTEQLTFPTADLIGVNSGFARQLAQGLVSLGRFHGHSELVLGTILTTFLRHLFCPPRVGV